MFVENFETFNPETNPYVQNFEIKKQKIKV